MPDRIIREIPLIERYARHNEDEDFRFRYYLKFDLNLSNKALDTAVQEITDDIWKQIDCTTCAHCCRTMLVVVDSKDVTRLSKRLGISPQKFSQKYVTQEDENAKVFATQPCPFLGEDNRCTVYEDRPQACRDFPYLHKKDFRTRTLMMISNLEVCPIVFNVWQEMKRVLWKRRRDNRRR